LGIQGQKVKLLDLYSGAGMASDGYKNAGFEIAGIDINLQPNYPYHFTQGDALEVLESDLPETFDIIHASPPCQAHTRAKHLRIAQGGDSKYEDFLTPTLEILNRKWSHKVWIVENVPGSPGMEKAVIHCGSSYDLQVRRHRLFLSNIKISGSTCNHKKQGRPWGVYHVMKDSIPKGGRTVTSLKHGLEAMGIQREIPWHSLKEGIPPKYTENIGKQIMKVKGYDL